MKKIKEMCEMQSKIYVLQSILQREYEISRQVEVGVPKPVAPREFQYSQMGIPDYDEEKYVKLAKAKGSGLGEFRHNALMATFVLASTLIGLLICWIPLLLCILSWPFSIYNTRKMAYKLYLEDCKNMENRNECNRIELEQFNRASVKYQNDLRFYENYQRNLSARKNALEQECNFANNALSKLIQNYSILVKELEFPSAYQDFASVNMIYSYISTGQANSVREAIQMFQYQVDGGKISTNLDFIKRNYSLFVNSMPEVVKSLKVCTSYVDKIERDLIEYVKAATNDRENTKSTLLKQYILNSST